jgi:NADH-quinone oxidoreductase subunit M
MPLFPEGAIAFGPWIVALSVIGIIYGALVAMVQSDVKKLVAYSSVSHLGFVMLGLFALNPQGIQGSVLQMINHGLSTGALFLAVGILYERRHTREIKEFGGVSEIMPWFAALFLIVCLSSLGLPGLNGFIGEFLILLGAFKANPWVAGISATGVILGAVYLLWMFQRVMFGPVTNDKNRGMPDLTRREFWVLAPVIVFIVWIGVYPNTFLRYLDTPAAELMERVSSRTIAARSVTPEYAGGDAASPRETEYDLGARGAGAAADAAPESALLPGGLAPPDSLPEAPEPTTTAPPVGSPGRVTP